MIFRQFLDSTLLYSITKCSILLFYSVLIQESTGRGGPRVERFGEVDRESSVSDAGTRPLIIFDWDDTLFPTSWSVKQNNYFYLTFI